MNTSRIKLLLILVACNFIWAINAMMSKKLVSEVDIHQAAWLRYTTAAIVFWVYWTILQFKRQALRKSFQSLIDPFKRSQTRYWMIALAVFPFFFSPMLQLRGLKNSQSIDNIIIIAIEPLLTVVLAWLLLKEPISRFHKICLTISMLGFLFLAKIYDQSATVHWVSCLMMLTALIGEAMYAVAGKKLSENYEPLTLFGAAITCGAILLTIVMSLTSGFPDLSLLSLRAMGASLWLGALGTSLCYILWLQVGHRLNLATMALTLFVQPVFGTFLGIWLMNEKLEQLQWVGVAFIFMSLLILVYEEIKLAHPKKSFFT